MQGLHSSVGPVQNSCIASSRPAPSPFARSRRRLTRSNATPVEPPSVSTCQPQITLLLPHRQSSSQTPEPDPTAASLVLHITTHVPGRSLRRQLPFASLLVRFLCAWPKNLAAKTLRSETRLYFKASPPLALIICIRMGGSYIDEGNADFSLHQKAHQHLLSKVRLYCRGQFRFFWTGCKPQEVERVRLSMHCFRPASRNTHAWHYRNCTSLRWTG